VLSPEDSPKLVVYRENVLPTTVYLQSNSLSSSLSYPLNQHTTDETQRQKSPSLSLDKPELYANQTSRTSRCPAEGPNRPRQPRWWLTTSVPTFWRSRWETRKPTGRKKWRMWKATPRAATSQSWRARGGEAVGGEGQRQTELQARRGGHWTAAEHTGVFPAWQWLRQWHA